MHSVFITRKIPDAGLKMLEGACNVSINPADRSLSKKEIVGELKGKDALLCMLSDQIDADVIKASRQLKAIANYGVGYNNIDVAAATSRGIAVTNTPGVLTDATADLAWALLFAAARRIAEGDRMVRTGKFNGWSPTMMLGQDVQGKILGVIGAGRIGTAFALKSKGFKMDVLYYANHRNEVLERELGAKKAALDELLKAADFISLHVPLTAETKHLIGERELRTMKKTAVLVNTARGPVIDEKALAKALKEKWIFGAGLDVYENEPMVNEELLLLDNVVLAPHIGSATVETRSRMAMMAVENIIAALEGKVPPNCVNPEYAKFRKR